MVEVKKIREKQGLTQIDFCVRYGFSLPTLQRWEQGTDVPYGHLLVLLLLIDRIPHEVAEAVRAIPELRAVPLGRPTLVHPPRPR